MHRRQFLLAGQLKYSAMIQQLAAKNNNYILAFKTTFKFILENTQASHSPKYK